MVSEGNTYHKGILLIGTLFFLLFCTKEVGNFYQSGHEGFVNAEVGLSHMNTINNGFLKTKFGATNYNVIHDRAPRKDEYYTRYPYLHNLLMACLWKLTGPSEVAARLFMTFLILSTLLIFYTLFKQLGYTKIQSAFMYVTLCSFPIFYHYSGFSNGEISCLLPLSLSVLFYLKFQKSGKCKHKVFFLISLSITCQLFWIGYIAALFFFADALMAFATRKNKKNLSTALALVLTCGINIALFILHTLWLVGSLNDVVNAFFWRTSLQAPAHQQFTLLEFINKNLGKWWLFNPIVIFLAILGTWAVLAPKKSDPSSSIKKRIAFLLLFPPLLFIFLLPHLVYWHDFLVIYFAFFLALISVDFLFRKTERMPGKKRISTQRAYLLALVVFAVFGLFNHPEEKTIDRNTDNYELYYLMKSVRHITSNQDKFLFSIDRIQEPQVRFYLRRESVFLKFERHAKAYIETGAYTHYIVENKPQFGSLLKYLLQNYRGYKYDRYFLFFLTRPNPSLRIFRRQKEETGLLFKYFVSPYHQPGTFREFTSEKTTQNVYSMFKNVKDLYQ